MSYDDVATSDRALETDGPSLKQPAKKITIHANEGYGFPVPGSATQVRFRHHPEGIKLLIRKELRRCGWPTKNVEVYEVRAAGLAPEEPGKFWIDIGEEFSGLRLEELWPVLTKLRSYCGHKEIREKLSRLTQEVVPTSASAILEKVG